MTDNTNKALADALAYGTGVMHKSDYVAYGDVYLAPHEVVIAEQAAEIERLGSVIDATALHWLALQDKHHVPWEGAIDGAMAAACAEIEKLREALEAVWKEATTMRNASKLVGPYPTQPEKNRLWARSMYHAGKRIMEMLKPIRAALGETK